SADAIVPDGHLEADLVAHAHVRGVRRLQDVDRRSRYADLGRRVVRTIVRRRHMTRVVDQTTGLITGTTGQLVRDRGDVHGEGRVGLRRPCRHRVRAAGQDTLLTDR